MDVKFFTSESVTKGHPDKICDQISDAVLDEFLKKDPFSRVALETICAKNLVLLFGEITANCSVNFDEIARRTIKNIGYYGDSNEFNFLDCEVRTKIGEQSKDIARGVDFALESSNGEFFELGAGDQGLVFGFACDETKELMPTAIVYAHKLAKRLDEVRENGIIKYLKPDGKTQVTVKYVNGIAESISTLVISNQHYENVSLKRIREDLIKHVILPTIPKNLISKETKILINPTGRFTIGGPFGDSGLTGRKIMVDSYGGFSRHGGGAFSGKDPTKVDRSGAYFARYVAKNVVAAKLAKVCEIQLSYAIGVANPISIMVNCFGTSFYSDSIIEKAIKKIFNFKPAAIIKKLNLRKPIYEKFARYGHFGREDLNPSWENVDMVDRLNEVVQEFSKIKVFVWID